MPENIWFVAAVWMAMAFAASLISIWTSISVALIEILVGVVAGNFFGVHASTDWINFLAMLGSGVLTFLAGAEIDPHSLRANLRASGLIGVISFIVPFAIVWLFAQFAMGWSMPQAQIAGIALSTTSVAVVYAVMIEGGLSDTSMGKMILAACFITDFGTVLALGGLFAHFNIWLLVFVIVMSVVLWFMPTWTKFIITRLGATKVSEPEVKFIFFILFFLGGLATTAKSEAVLPAYLVGLVVAGVFLRDKTLVHRMRSIAFAMFSERRGMNVVVGYCIGTPAQSLVFAADSGACRLIVLGHQGHSGLWGRLLGGTADIVSHHAQCDVLIVRPRRSSK